MQHPQQHYHQPLAQSPYPPQYEYRAPAEFAYAMSPSASSVASYHPSTPGPSSICSSPVSSSTGPKHRINLACAYCRRRKIKCTGEANCVNCVRTGRQCIYEQVSEEQNRVTKQRKAHLKALKIQSLQGLDVSRGQTLPIRGRAHARTTSMPYFPSRLAPPAPISGWTPEIPQYEAFSAPSTSTIATGPLSTRPFPSVLTNTPMHAAYVANSGRCSPAEQQTYAQAFEPRSTLGSSTTPPRSRSPSPSQFPPSIMGNYTRGPPPGYTSYFPQTPYSPTDSLKSTFTSTSPDTPFTPFEPAFQRSSTTNEKEYSYGTYEAPLSHSLGISIAHPVNGSGSYHSPSLDQDAHAVSDEAAHFYLPPSPTRKPRHPAYHRATQSLGGNPGLGFELPKGFAPGLPVDPAYESTVQDMSACHLEVAYEEPQEEVTYSWGN